MKYQQEKKKKRKKIVVQNIIPISKQINTLIVSYPDTIFIRDRCNRAIFTSLFSLVYLSGIKYRKIRGEEVLYLYTDNKYRRKKGIEKGVRIHRGRNRGGKPCIEQTGGQRLRYNYL